jgi:hypothetical protein
MGLPECRNYKKCGNSGFIYIYGNFYCGNCVKKAQDKMRIAEEKMLIEEDAD